MKKIKFISDLVKFDEENRKVTEINWTKFTDLERLSNHGDLKTKERANRDLSKCILYLLRTKVLSKNLEKSYVLNNDNDREKIISPNKDGIRYGFVRKKDAEEYARAIYLPEVCDHLIIDYYKGSPKLEAIV
ncbi:MAG: hypothetical protein AABX83_02485 [Nanoarchaeota archaeon]